MVVGCISVGCFSSVLKLAGDDELEGRAAFANVVFGGIAATLSLEKGIKALDLLS